MTVAELMRALSTLDQEATVVTAYRKSPEIGSAIEAVFQQEVVDEGKTIRVAVLEYGRDSYELISDEDEE